MKYYSTWHFNMEQLQSSVLFSDSNNQTDRCERAEREREGERESLGEQFDMYTVFRCKKAECKENWERQRKRLEESDWKISLSFDF